MGQVRRWFLLPGSSCGEITAITTGRQMADDSIMFQIGLTLLFLIETLGSYRVDICTILYWNVHEWNVHKTTTYIIIMK